MSSLAGMVGGAKIRRGVVRTRGWSQTVASCLYWTVMKMTRHTKQGGEERGGPSEWRPGVR